MSYIDIPYDARTGSCRSCGEPIWWTQTVRGKWLPVSVERDDPQQCEPRDGLDGVGVAHFANCPQADDWRRPQ